MPETAPANLDSARFMNAVRILHSIDRHELAEAGIVLSVERWQSFRDDPVLWLLQADDDKADRIWSIIEKRQPKRST